PVVCAEHARNVHRVPALEGLNDDKACVLLVLTVYLFRRQTSRAGNLPVEIICVSRSVAGNAASCLRPGGRPRRMRMYHASDLRKRLIKLQMGRGIGRRIVISLYLVS